MTVELSGGIVLDLPRDLAEPRSRRDGYVDGLDERSQAVADDETVQGAPEDPETPPDPVRLGYQRAEDDLTLVARFYSQLEGSSSPLRQRFGGEASTNRPDWVDEASREFSRAVVAYRRFKTFTAAHPLLARCLRFVYLEHGPEWRMAVDVHVEVGREFALRELRALWSLHTRPSLRDGLPRFYGRALLTRALEAYAEFSRNP